MTSEAGIGKDGTNLACEFDRFGCPDLEKYSARSQSAEVAESRKVGHCGGGTVVTQHRESGSQGEEPSGATSPARGKVAGIRALKKRATRMVKVLRMECLVIPTGRGGTGRIPAQAAF